MKILSVISIIIAIFFSIRLMEDKELILVNDDNFGKEASVAEKEKQLNPDQLWEQQQKLRSQTTKAPLAKPKVLRLESFADETLSAEEVAYMNVPPAEARESSSITLYTSDESQNPENFYLEEPILEPLDEGLSPQESQELAEQEGFDPASLADDIPVEFPEEDEDPEEIDDMGLD